MQRSALLAAGHDGGMRQLFSGFHGHAGYLDDDRDLDSQHGRGQGHECHEGRGGQGLARNYGLASCPGNSWCSGMGPLNWFNRAPIQFP